MYFFHKIFSIVFPQAKRENDEGVCNLFPTIHCVFITYIITHSQFLGPWISFGPIYFPVSCIVLPDIYLMLSQRKVCNWQIDGF